MAREGFRRRFIALVVVVALHFFFLTMLVLRESIVPSVVYYEPSSEVFFIETPRPRMTTPPPALPRTTRSPPSAISEPTTVEHTSSAPDTPPDPSPPIDWTAQATQAATAAVDKAIREDTRKCDPADSPRSFLPPCNPRTKKFEWNPEPRRVGFSGGLPYVRIGERCAIGLGFFGCGFGDPPPANGDLFEGMDDPERDRSSVPSPDPPQNDQRN